MCKSLHRVMEGWALEELILKKLSQLGSQDKMVLVRQEGESKISEESWRTCELVSLDMASFSKNRLASSGNVIKFSPEKTLLLRPDTYHNESWDAVLVFWEHGQFHLKFLEITLQRSHKLNEMVLLGAYKTFNVPLHGQVSPVVKHIGVVDSAVFKEFRFKRSVALPTMRTRGQQEAEIGGEPSIVPDEFAIEVYVARMVMD